MIATPLWKHYATCFKPFANKFNLFTNGCRILHQWILFIGESSDCKKDGSFYFNPAKRNCFHMTFGS